MRRLIPLFFLGLVLAGIVSIFRFGGSLARTGEYDSIVFDFRDTPEAIAQVETAAQEFGLDLSLNSKFSTADNIYVAKGDRHTIAKFRASELSQFAEFVEPNYIYTLEGRPNDPDFSKQWNLANIKAESAWNVSAGKDVTVAVIDTGVTQTKDLSRTKFVPGYDFVNDREQADDDNGHGTHVAGTIAQSTNNRYGVAGIAHEAQIMPLKVLSAFGGGTVADIAEAIRFAADNGADIINMSLGGGGASELMQSAIDYAYSKGVMIIAAAGNERSSSAAYPARYEHVMAVAAYDANNQKAPYSNYGAGVNISAPGGSTAAGDSGGILQETIDRRTGNAAFKYFQGTSMAAPHVSGVAALIKEAGVKEPDKIWSILEKSAQKMPADEQNYFGAGRLDAAAAVRMASESLPSPLPHIGNPLNRFIWFNWKAIPWKTIAIRWGGVILLTVGLSKVAQHNRWNALYWLGALVGSVGLFALPKLYLFDLPQWPLRLLGSSLPELGSLVFHTSLLNPITASALLPFLLLAGLLGHPTLKWVAVGGAVGVTAMLSVSAIMQPQMMWIGGGWGASLFLGVNAALSLLIGYLGLKTITTETI